MSINNYPTLSSVPLFPCFVIPFLAERRCLFNTAAAPGLHQYSSVWEAGGDERDEGHYETLGEWVTQTGVSATLEATDAHLSP